MTTRYNAWKQQQENNIYKETWRPHAPVILMMIIERIKEKHILNYLSKELGLKKPKKALQKCRSWASAPDPRQLSTLSKKRQNELLDKLTIIWQIECNVPQSEKALATWLPKPGFEFDYENILLEEKKKTQRDTAKELVHSLWNHSSEKSESEEGLDNLIDDSSDEIEIPKNNLTNPLDGSDNETETPKNAPEPSPPLYSHAQEIALKELNDAYAVSQKTQNLKLSFSPRTNCLMVAPSGSGKTFLAQSFAKQKEVPFMSVNVSSWMVIGGRSESANCTLVRIAAFIDKNPNGIIYLDELDKIDSQSSPWLQHVRLEIHNLLDCQIGGEVIDGLQTILEKDIEASDLDKINQTLKNDFFVIAGGTWQEFWENRSVTSVGFNSTEEMRSLNKEELTKHITPELLQRFQQNHIVISPLTQEDFLSLAEKLAEQFDSHNLEDDAEVRNRFLEIVKTGVEEAVKNQIGMRFLEECITEAIKPKASDESLKSSPIAN